MVGPIIYTFGTEEQKQRFLPDILQFNTWWCQGYSEPGSGSDLASLKTRADLNGDHYIVNGTKTWTTLGQYADWIFCLVRTNSDVARRCPQCERGARSSLLEVRDRHCSRNVSRHCALFAASDRQSAQASGGHGRRGRGQLQRRH